MPADVLAGRAAALPAAERLHTRPRAGGRAGGAVHVDDAGLDPVEKGVDLARLAREHPGCQPEARVVGARQRLVEAADALDGEDRYEQLVAHQRVVLGQPGQQGRLDEVAVGTLTVGQDTAARRDGATGGADETLEVLVAGARRHGPEERLFPRGITDAGRRQLRAQAER